MDPLNTADSDIEPPDSAYGSSPQRSTMTVQSWVDKSISENGRTYHLYKEGAYPFPNDEREQQRLEHQHILFLMSLDGHLYLSPINQTHRVFELGTGTGLWAIDFADSHPEALIEGVDLSNIMPRFVPPNVSFSLDDVREEWRGDGSYDFIFSRAPWGSFSKTGWPKLFQQAYSRLRPGGYFEIQDFCLPLVADDSSSKSSLAIRRWCQDMLEAGRRMDKPMTTLGQHERNMKDVGFVDVKEKEFKWPIGDWHGEKRQKHIGVLHEDNWMDGLEGFSLALFSRGLCRSLESIQRDLVYVREDLRDRSFRMFQSVTITYGRKPE